MATSKEFIEYVYEQAAAAGQVSYRKMFGEYGVYLDGKIVALVCDNMFFLKPTAAARRLLAEEERLEEAPPYQGANPFYLVDSLDDRDFLCRLLRESWEELPFPQTKKPREPKPEKETRGSKQPKGPKGQK
ncbi:MAG: TfoX/Sxy family protein [Peptococcaceae bacterium]|nr:TfoX/Sxy family protein [Peptococcaceae bacterium]